jgi:membrane protease subunit HflK
MAWNEPGNKRRDPWQDGGGGGKEPDIDAMLKRARDRFGRTFGGGGGTGGGPGGGLWLLVLGIIAIWFLFDSARTIDETQRGVVLRFGKFHRIMPAGLNFKWPTPIEQVFVVDATRVRSESDQVRLLTKDENIVVVDFNVQYTVNDPYKFQFSVREPDQTLRQVAESAVREVIGGNTMDAILLGERTALALSAREILQETLDRYGTGILVTEFNFQNPKAPQEVQDAFADAIAAREDKQRLENEARAYSSKVVPEARGNAQRVRIRAEGDRAAAIAAAEGAAKRFALVAEQYRAAPDVTRKRLYLETMQEVLGRTPKVVVSSDGDKVLYLPLNELKAAATGNGTTTPAPVVDMPPERAAVTASPVIENPRERGRGREGRN